MGLMHTVKKSKKILRSALVLVMAFLIATTTLTQAYASYFPIVVQHVFLDDAEKAKEEEAANQGGGEDTDAPEEPDAGEENQTPAEDPDAPETPGLAEELKNLTSTHEMQMKGVYGDYYSKLSGEWSASDGTYYGRFDVNSEEIKKAIEAGNFSVDDTSQVEYEYGIREYLDVTVKTDIGVSAENKDHGIAMGEAAVDAAMEQLFSGENEDAALLLSELQAAMSGGSLADKYDVERKMLALCAKQGLDAPTDEELAECFPYMKDENGNYVYDEEGNQVRDYLNAGGRAKAAEYKLNFITGFTAKFRQTCEAAAKGMPEAATLELVELDSQDSSAAVQTVEDSLAANPAVSSKQAAAAAEVVADMLEVLDSWSVTSTGGKVKGTNMSLGGEYGERAYGFHEASGNYLGNAELTDDSRQALLDNGYKSSSLEIQVVVAMSRNKLDENGNKVLDEKGKEVFESYSKVYVSLDGDNWTDADDPDGEPVDADTVFGSGEVELCTYTFTHSHRAKAPLRPRPEDPKDPDPKPEDPKDPDPKPEDSKDPDPKPEDPKDPDPKPENPKDPDPKPEPKPTPTPEENIPEEDVPLTELPEEEVPLAEEPEEEPEEVEIPEEDVPLSEIPKTGDNSFLWMCAALLSGAALLVVTRRKEEAEEA